MQRTTKFHDCPFGRLLRMGCFFTFIVACATGCLDSANLFAQVAPTTSAIQSPQEAVVPIEFLGVPLFDNDFYKLLVRLSIDLIFVGLVVGVAYHWHQKNKAYVFTFLLMNIIIFFICFTLKKLEIGIGMALGLFAIFAIIRYRTDAIKVKEMTYLFIVVGLAVINSLSNKKMSYAELMFINSFIFLATMALEGMFMKKRTPKLDSRDLVYDKIELLHPNRRSDLIDDLTSRTGLNVQRVEIKKIDLGKGTATIAVRYPRVEPDVGLET